MPVLALTPPPDAILWNGVAADRLCVGGTLVWEAPIDPEAGLALTLEIAAGTFIAASTLDRGVATVVAMDLTGLDGAGGGLIWEQGGGGAGLYVGFEADGTFLTRAGNGSAGTGWQARTAPPAAPHGDGTLVVEISPYFGSWQTRSWWRGRPLTTVVSGSAEADTQNTWAGGNDGTYLDVAQAVTNAQPNWPVAYATAGAMRVYQGQVVVS